MISKTRGIVINYIKYQESSIICKIYTEDFGIQSFIINGIRSPKAKRSIGFFQPFSLLELEVYQKPNREIQRLADYKFIKTTPAIYEDMTKNSVVLFLSEITGKLLSGENEPHPNLFEFMMESIIEFNSLKAGVENFHLHFLLVLPSYLGYRVEDDLLDVSPASGRENLQHLVQELMSSPYDHPIKTTGKIRYQLLEALISFYRLHTPQLGEIKSLKVLHNLFS
jgi:DNA repair protein RecO (recombination protein O)